MRALQKFLVIYPLNCSTEGRSTAGSEQIRVMWCEQREREPHEDPMCRCRGLLLSIVAKENAFHTTSNYVKTYGPCFTAIFHPATEKRTILAVG
jgi:hypothetical protein